jgi:hypothetical protein
MNKYTIATLVGVASVALTATTALAWSHDLTIRAPYTHTAGTATATIVGAKPSCDVQSKLFDKTATADNTAVTSPDDNAESIRVANAITKFVGVETARVAFTPSLAGFYQIDSAIVNVGSNCKHLGGGTTATKAIVVGDNVRIDTFDWDESAEVHDGRNDYDVQFVGDVRTNATSDRLRAGVTVQLWVPNLAGTKMVLVEGDVTNARGEFEINYRWDADLHGTEDFQLRVARTAKFFQDYSSDVADGEVDVL